jgi:calcium-dependent protein kinase
MDPLRLSPGDFVSERRGFLQDVYRVGTKLGDGAFGSVHKITHRTTREVRAVKVIRKANLRAAHEREMFFNEVAVLRSIDHPNVLKLYEFFQDDRSYYLITEYCEGGELFDRIIEEGSFSENQAAECIRQVLSVVAYCHERGIVHRDLKPENFLLDTKARDANLKVIDFGTAKVVTPGQMMTDRYGTPYYIAPEVAKASPRYNEKCDVWSCGVNLYILLCGYPPFTADSDDKIMRKVLLGRFTFPEEEWRNVSPEAKDLITKMLTYDPESRLSARQALDHPWIRHASRVPLSSSSAVGIFRNLRSFRAGQKLQQATLTFIATQLATKEERDEMKQVFKSLDTDSSGTLSRTELINGFHILYGHRMENAEEEADRIMREVDRDGSGEIDYSEFVLATMNRNKLISKERLESAFQAFDSDGSGTISLGEIKMMLGQAKGLDEEVFQQMIREADTNGDGVIDKREFVSMMTRILTR